MLTHYIIVRRDLPLGTLAAMITHAAGESSAYYEDPYDGRFRGAHAVVLGVDSEKALDRLADKLFDLDIPNVRIRESSYPWNGALMAVGVVPGEKEKIFPVLKNYLLLRDLIIPVDDGA